MANIMQSGPRGLDHDRHEGRREADGSMYKSHRQTLRTSSALAASQAVFKPFPSSFHVFSRAPKW